MLIKFIDILNTVFGDVQNLCMWRGLKPIMNKQDKLDFLPFHQTLNGH